MIHYRSGNILHAREEAIVNPVNCVGVMGRGLALDFKRRFPDNFSAYVDACHGRAVRPGRMFVFETGDSGWPKFIVNFPTKRHWHEPSRLEDIETGLDDLRRVVRFRGIRSIAIPALGCGLGGLVWHDVRPRIEQVLAPLQSTVRVIVYEPAGEK